VKTRVPTGKVHKSYGAHVGQPDRAALARLAVCNNINGSITASGLVSPDDSKVTCKRCLRIMAGRPVTSAVGGAR
jgi:hypothetical protein